MTQKDVILAIDDEDVILKLIKGQLESKFKDRFIYKQANDVEEARTVLEDIKKQGLSLVMAIVDEILPGMRGHEFLAELNSIDKRVIKILFSGRSDLDSVISAINEAQIFRYLVKPWNDEDFLEIVEKGLQQYYIKENNELQLAEIHHRVKNNLTIISCLLQLQIGELEDAESKVYFQQSINRINSIAKVHELIYDSEDMSSVDIKFYLDRIVPAIRDSMQNFDKKVEVNLDIPSHRLKVNQAIPLGLMFNELITNSFKYAFDNVEQGEISIKMTADINRITFTYEDNGNGFKENYDFRNSTNLGLTLIHLQLQQLDSEHHVHTNGKFRLQFTFDAFSTEQKDSSLVLF